MAVDDVLNLRNNGRKINGLHMYLLKMMNSAHPLDRESLRVYNKNMLSCIHYTSSIPNLQDEIEDRLMNSDTVFKNDRMEHTLLRYQPTDRLECVHIFRRPAFHLPPHSHSFWHFIYVMEGELTVSTDGRVIPLGVGHGLFQPADCIHALSSLGYRQLGINFYPDERMRAAISRPIAAVLPEIFPLLRQMEELTPDAPFFDEQLAACSETILYAALNAVSRQEKNPLRQRILDAFDQHLDGTFSLALLAAELFISPSYLERLCRQFFGMSALALCNRRRFERVCGLLTGTTLTVREIGEAAGEG
ncbi:MAG: AraC family transcriptional regulator, partial [Ruminococcaceae bacterium]|nr:AraC family transcriptional regulator [Oscillospiraceae bacterium]